ncbi:MULTISPECIES: PLxRFG domain-containing protein [Acinetobacter]|uniref:PLxRFG domain-containing protein n=1 Tax=Acinetobacter piscicola TaxID=2006115 RepID=A0A7S6VVC4_9GAMM|nr:MULTISPECIES: PLxRFG domain-containing protein [Acinetobacter]QOW45549.1 PLxRFG domain-containing protein [Acinetobacter piscicola]
MSESTLKPFTGKLDENIDTNQQPALKPFTGALDGEDKGFLGQAKDHAVSFLGKGTVAVGELAVGLSDMMSDGATGKILSEKLGYDPKAAKNVMTGWQSEQYQQQLKDSENIGNREIEEGDDFATKVGKKFDNAVDITKNAISNPSLITNTVAESLPSMLAGAVLGRVSGIANPVVAGSVGEAAVMAGSQAEQIRQETVDGRLTADQSLASVATGAIGGLFGYVGGRLAQKMGLSDVDTAMQTGRLTTQQVGEEIAKTPMRAIPTAVIKGAISEGFLEELPQSVSEQILQNLALDKPWHDGVENAAVMGTLAGMAMGGTVSGAGKTGDWWNSRSDTGPQDNQQQSGSPNLPSAPPQLGSSPDSALTGEYIPRENVSEGDNNQGRTAFVYDQPSMEADNLLNNNYKGDAGFDTSGNFGPSNNPDSPLSPSGGNYFDDHPTQPPSERLGINPNDGPMSSAAALAVNSGASPIAQLGYTEQQQGQEQGNTPISDAVPSNYQSLLGSQNDGQPFDARLEDATVQQGNTQADNAGESISQQYDANAADAMGGGIETDRAKTTTAQTAQPILDQDGKNKWFGNQEKAQAFIDKKKLGNNYQVVQDGKRFEIQPIDQNQDHEKLTRAEQESEGWDGKTGTENTIQTSKNSNLNSQNTISNTENNIDKIQKISALEQQLKNEKSVPKKAQIRKQITELQNGLADQTQSEVNLDQPRKATAENLSGEFKKMEESTARVNAVRQRMREANPEIFTAENDRVRETHGLTNARVTMMADEIETSGSYELSDREYEKIYNNPNFKIDYNPKTFTGTVTAIKDPHIGEWVGNNDPIDQVTPSDPQQDIQQFINENKAAFATNWQKGGQPEITTAPFGSEKIQKQYGDTAESVMSDIEILGDDFTIDLRDKNKKTNALNNPNYNAVQKADGSVEIVGMKHPTTGEWVGKKPSTISIEESAQNNMSESTQWTKHPTRKKTWIADNGMMITDESSLGKKTFYVFKDRSGYEQWDFLARAESLIDAKQKAVNILTKNSSEKLPKNTKPIESDPITQPKNFKDSIENIRAEKIRQKDLADMHNSVYGLATDEQLQESLKHLNKEIKKAQKQSENEVVNGKRSTRKAVAAGALDRFLKNRVDLETYIKARKNGELKQRNKKIDDYSRDKLKPDNERKGVSPLDTTFNPLSVVSATRRVLSVLQHLKMTATQDASFSGRINVSLNNRIGVNKVGNVNSNGFSVQVISSFSDLPKVIQNDATYKDENGKTQNYDVSGVWHDGTLYVVADQVYGDSNKQLTTFDAYEELLTHEIVGHFGVQKLFGNEYKTKFQQLFNALGKLEGIRKIAKDNGVDMQQFESAYIEPYTQGVKDEIYTESDVQQALVSELFAFVAQNAKSRPFVRQKLKEVLGYIRQWFRDRGFDKFLSRYNDADLMMFLSEARKAVVDRSYFGKYKNQEFSSKNNSDTPLYSRRTKSNSGSTTQQVRDVLIDRFGKETIDELERQGKLEIIQDYQVEGVEGFYYNGKAVLVASNLTAESTVPTFLHELGGHAGFQNMMNQKQYNELMNQFNKLVEQGNPVALTAKMLAEREQGSERQQLEYLPYLLTLSSTMQQRNVIQRNALQKLINNIVSYVKAWVFDNFGINLNLNPDDMLALSERMIGQIKHQSSLDLIRQKYHGTNQWMTAPNGAKTHLSEQQWLQVRTPEFKKWFGDWENDAANASQVLDENGEPKVVYHGTATEFNEFKQGHGLLGDGIYLTDSFDTADVYANIRGENGFVLPLFVNIRNVFKTTGNVSRDEFVEATTSGKYQGIVHQFENHEYIVALEPNQVKMAEGNKGTFNSESSDIRFSRSAKDIIDNLSKNLGNISISSVKDKTGYKFTDWLGVGLSALGRRQLTEIYSKILPQLNKYNELAAQMDADKNDAGAEADSIVREWANLNDEDQLAELMHDSTLAKIDPTKPYVKGDSVSRYKQLRDDYNSLSPEAQAMYLKARDAYKKHYAKVQSAIKDRILRASLSSQKKADLIKQMDDQFYGYVKGVYFPLARFGKYVVVVRNQNGDVESVSRAETMGEAQKIRSEMLKKFPQWKVEPVIQDKEFRSARDAVGRGFMSSLFDEVANLGLSSTEQASFEDTLNQLYLSSMPDLSWAKHGIHRKGTAGFSNDARRAFAQHMFSGANYLAKLRYGDQLADQLDAMQKYADDQIKQNHQYNQSTAQSVIDEMNKRHENLMNPKGHPLSSALTSLGFIYYLGLSPAAAMVNLSQTALVAYPLMGAKWDFDKAGKELLKASNDFRKGVEFHKVKWQGTKTDLYKAVSSDISKFLNKDEQAAYQKAVDSGAIDVTQAHDLAGIAQGEDSGVMWKTRPIMRAASVMFHSAERFNREVTFIASYRLARQAGANHDDAYEQADKMTYDSQYDYGSGNRPRIMQGNVAKVLLLFKQFGQNMVYTLARQTYQSIKGETKEERREARRAISAILAMHATFAGALGLPMVGMLLSVASWMGGDDDDPWDAEVALRNYLAEAFNPTISNMLMKGAPRGIGVDISGRVGINNLLLPDVQEGLEGKKWWDSASAAVLGPIGGIGANIAKGAQEISEGHNLRGVESMLPVFLKNFAKTYRYADEGVQDKTGVSIMDEVSSMDLLVQGMGFSPSDVRTASEGKTAIYQLNRKLNERRSRLMALWSRAKMMDDQQEMDEIWEEIQGFNDKNPSRRITRMNLNQSYRNRQRRIDRAEDGIYLSRNRQDAREAGYFAFGE